MAAGSGGFANLDGIVAGLENNFWSARRAVFAFQVRVALIGTRGLQGASRKFRIDIAGTAIGLNVEARRRRNAQGDGSAFVVDRDVFLGRIGKLQFNGTVDVVERDSTGDVFQRHRNVFCARCQVARSVGDFQVAAGFFKVSAQ